MITLNEIKGGVTAAQGFYAAGVHAGVKASNHTKKDVALIKSTVPAQVGGVFTTNVFAAAPVAWCRQVVAGGIAQAIICNSGCANACTGDIGARDAAEMASLTAAALGIQPQNVLVASTGVIGKPLPMEVIAGGINGCTAALSAAGSADAAQAIMTTDTYAKEVAYSFELNGTTIKLGGIAKGSGMIHPNMATMLCFVTTDAAIAAEAITAAVKEAADATFNMVTVDGDTSTNDSLMVLANAQAGNAQIALHGAGYSEFVEALTVLCGRLSKMIAHDGEGATKLLTATVNSAANLADARLAAKAIVSSSLTKCAFFGEDANWGRIICAVGYSGAQVATDKVDLWLASAGGRIQMMAQGACLDFDEAEAAKILHEQEIEIQVDLNLGVDTATAWGCDLTYDYVKINGDYRT